MSSFESRVVDTVFAVISPEDNGLSQETKVFRDRAEAREYRNYIGQHAFVQPVDVYAGREVFD